MRRLTASEKAARLRRIARFVDDFTQVLEGRCRVNHISCAVLEPFANEMFSKMARSRELFDMFELAEMLADETTRTRVFLRYRDRLAP